MKKVFFTLLVLGVSLCFAMATVAGATSATKNSTQKTTKNTLPANEKPAKKDGGGGNHERGKK